MIVVKDIAGGWLKWNLAIVTHVHKHTAQTQRLTEEEEEEVEGSLQTIKGRLIL